MLDHEKIKELDSHWDEIMDIARKYGFIAQAAGGTAILLTHENQLKADGENKYIRRQRDLFEIDMRMADESNTEIPRE